MSLGTYGDLLRLPNSIYLYDLHRCAHRTPLCAAREYKRLGIWRVGRVGLTWIFGDMMPSLPPIKNLVWRMRAEFTGKERANSRDDYRRRFRR
jgi:hypothetical protein